MKTLEEVKNWCRWDPTHFALFPEEKEYYHLDDETIRKWRTEFSVESKEKFYELVNEFNHGEKNLNKIFNLKYYFSCSANDNLTESWYYEEIPAIYVTMYENDLFDQLSYVDYREQRNAQYNETLFADVYYPERDPNARLYDNQKYMGKIPLLYYSGHKDVFEEVLIYFANTIYQKYGLYLQYSMNILIQFSKEYNLPYTDMLIEAKRKAKEEDYPAHHEYTYQFLPRLNVKWKE